MSDREIISSPNVALENRSLDQWKVTELKEELERRKLITKGVKDDLVKRLDEAMRAELAESDQKHENGVNQPEVPPDNVVEPVVTEETTTSVDESSAKNESLKENVEKDNMSENLDNENRDDRDVDDGLNSSGKNRVVEGSEETSVEVLQKVEINKEEVSILLQQEDEESKREVKPDIGSQVAEVSEVKSESISIETISNTEKNELKDDNISGDDVKLEQHDVIDGDAKTESVVVVDEKDVKKSDSGEVGSPEKLNLDRSSGDDSMEEDALESKQIDSKFVSHENTQVNVDVMVEDAPKNEITKDKTDPDPSVGSTKRKLHGDQEASMNIEVVKRQRRWNPEQQTTNSSVCTTPKDSFQAKHSFSRSNSSVSHEEPKERIVPPSSKPPTSSLRIDRFLRPFTLKAVQELLGKTGTIVDFWMDHIKTHCYVTYLSVEEAIETRNAVYNLQWPKNGGRLLIAEFVDPSEVKSQTEAPLPSPVTATTPPPPATATQPPLHHLPPPPPLPLPPPPPLHSREPALPPPPPLPQKSEPPVMTLDDLFQKTRATPRIYYLPLSDEQVAAKLKKAESSRRNE